MSPLMTARNTRLLTREQLELAQAAWDRVMHGRFAEEWAPWRRLAEQHGIAGPPDGDEWDSWASPNPSQYAIVIRAIRETPEILHRAIAARGPATWSKVCALVVQQRDQAREEADARAAREEADWARAKAEDRAGAGAALSRLAGVVGDGELIGRIGS